METVNPIISLIVRDQARDILIGVRNPEVNKTHPHVVSTPTQRIPRALADIILQGTQLVKTTLPNLHFTGVEIQAYQVKNSPSRTYSGREEENEEESDPLIYVVTTLLARKLCSPPLPKFTAHVASIVEGTLLYDKSEALPEMKRNEAGFYYEEAKMIDVEVNLLSPPPPFNSVSYSHLTLVPEEKFKEMVRTRSTEPVVDLLGQKSLMYCVKGMCLQAAYVAVRERS